MGDNKTSEQASTPMGDFKPSQPNQPTPDTPPAPPNTPVNNTPDKNVAPSQQTPQPWPMSDKKPLVNYTPAPTTPTTPQFQPTVQNAGIPAAPPIYTTPTAPATESIFGEKEATALTKQIMEIIEKSKKRMKLSPEQKKQEKLNQQMNAISSVVFGGKLNFEMKINKEANKLTLECTNLAQEAKAFEETIKSMKRLRGKPRGRTRGRGRGRGRGRETRDAGPLATSARVKSTPRRASAKRSRSARRSSPSMAMSRGAGRGRRRVVRRRAMANDDDSN